MATLPETVQKCEEVNFFTYFDSLLLIPVYSVEMFDCTICTCMLFEASNLYRENTAKVRHFFIKAGFFTVLKVDLLV